MKKFYIIILFILTFSQIYAVSDPTAGLKEISLTGLKTDDGHTFHLYSADGKLNRGFSEFFIALSDKNNNYIDSFTVSNFYPLMDMGMMKHSSPVGKVEKVAGKALYRTWISFLMSSSQGGSWSLSFDYTIGKGSSKSAIISTPLKSDILKDATVHHDTITQIGWFKDRCPFCLGGGIGKVTLPLLKSCGIGCGTSSVGMADCWSSGLGIYIYNPTDTGKIIRDTAISDTHYLLGDAQSKELIRAFLLGLPSDASGKISVKVSGYWVPNGISANKTETFVPELSPDSTVHYLKAFHLLSIEGVVIPNQSNSYAGFATNSYKLTPQDLAPSKLSTLFDTVGVTVKFTPPANEGKAKSNLKGYKIKIYDNTGAIQSQYTITVNDTTIRAIKISGLKASDYYSYSVAALYPSSAVEVESAFSNGIETQIGWFKDRDCVWGPKDSVTLPLQTSCWVSCGIGAGGMAGCFNSGLGVFIYNPKESGKISIDSAVKDSHYLLADPQSKELIRAFLEQLPINADQSSPADQKISVKVTGYWVKNGISANKSETYVPEINPDSTVHYLDAFHYLSIEGVVIPNDTNSFAGFATNSYKLTPQDLAPSNLSLASYAGGVTVKFTPPANKADTGTSNLKGYKVRVYDKTGLLQSQFTTTKNDTSVKAINIPGLKATAGYTFTVSALYPVSGVEVESDKSALANTISGIALQVDDYAANSLWINKFTYNDTTFFLSLAYPKSLIVGSQTVKAYVNKEVDLLQPFPVAYGGFKIVPTPFMRSMGHSSHGNDSILAWNTTDSVYEGTLNFSMEGDWRINLKVYDAKTDTLLKGVDLDPQGDNSTVFWDIYLENSNGIKDVKSDGILVYPTLSHGEITVVSPAEARIKVVELTGQTIGYYQSAGSKTIQLNVVPGLYFVSVESSGKTFTQKVIVNK